MGLAAPARPEQTLPRCLGCDISRHRHSATCLRRHLRPRHNARRLPRSHTRICRQPTEHRPIRQKITAPRTRRNSLLHHSRQGSGRLRMRHPLGRQLDWRGLVQSGGSRRYTIRHRLRGRAHTAGDCLPTGTLHCRGIHTAMESQWPRIRHDPALHHMGRTPRHRSGYLRTIRRPDGSFATGVLRLDNGNGAVSPRGTAISCGTSTPDKKRPGHIETLAVGIYAPDSLVYDVREDSLNYLLTLNPDAAGHISYSIAFASAKEEGAHL